MPSNSTAIQYSLTVNTELSYSEIRKLEIVLIRTLNYVEMFSGSKDLNKALRLAQQSIIVFKSLQMSMRAAQMASGPLGWAYFGVSVVASGMAGYSMYESMIGV